MGRLNWNKPNGSPGTEGERPSGEWEIPTATDGGADPWVGPGSLRGVDSRREANVGAPFQCSVCGAALRIEGAFASGGDFYCFEDKPKGARAGLDLPSDGASRWASPDSGARGVVQRVTRWLWQVLTSETRR